MKTKHAAQIRHGIHIAQQHVADRDSGTSTLTLDSLHQLERGKFLRTRLERRAYWATRFKHFGMGHTFSRTGAAV